MNTQQQKVIDDFTDKLQTLIVESSSGEHPTLGSGTFITFNKREFYNQVENYLKDIILNITEQENKKVLDMVLRTIEKEAIIKGKKALEKVGLLDRMNNLPSQLSGGQQQRVAIARAISHDPKIIFADEPTANLDSETSHQVMQVFLDLNKEGQTIVMVTHEDEYAKLAHRTISLADGKIVSDILNK